MAIPMNQSGRYSFRELEMLVIEYLDKKYKPEVKGGGTDSDKIHIGDMIMDIIMLCENLGLDFTECLAAAYSAKTGQYK